MTIQTNTSNTLKEGNGMLVKFSSLGGGCFVEVLDGASDYEPHHRCFRFDADGRAEWTSQYDLATHGDRARWFGHQYTEKDFTFA